MGQASKYNAWAMDMILDELRSNNIEIEKYYRFILTLVLENMNNYMGRLSFDWIKITCQIVCVIFTKRCVPITLTDL